MSIEFKCSACDTPIHINDRLAGRQINCPTCGHPLNVPGASQTTWVEPPERPTRQTPRNARRDGDSIRRKSRYPAMRYARPLTIRGEVAGLEKVREQHIHGHGYLSGGHVLMGSYTGADFALGRQIQQARGSIGGYGSIHGEHRTWTSYRYETIFFIRDSHGRDFPVRIVGETLPLLDGHAVTAVVLKNRWNESILCAIVNRSTSMIHWTVGERDLIRFLGIPRRRRVRAELMSPYERSEEVSDRNAMLRACSPFLLGVCFVGVAFALISVLLLVAGQSATGGWMLSLGGGAAFVCGLWWFILYWRVHEARCMPLTETITVRNREIGEELDAIERFVNGLLVA